ncbi:MAG: hypothetical protein AB4368_30535 [Xenococcaceae cyanobacterium]
MTIKFIALQRYSNAVFHFYTPSSDRAIYLANLLINKVDTSVPLDRLWVKTLVITITS